MSPDQEIAFTFSGGALHPDAVLDLPEGTRGVATIRALIVRRNGVARATALATIRRIGDSNVFDSGKRRLTRDEMHERD